MKIKQLRIFVEALDDNTEVYIRNHHSEEKPVVDVEFKGQKKTQEVVLVLAEEKVVTMTNKDTQGLEPCPFCGCETTPFLQGVYEGNVKCTNEEECGAQISGFTKQVHAIKAWNTRTQQPDTITLTLKELESMRRECVYPEYGMSCSKTAVENDKSKGRNEIINELLEKMK